jgi:hypothetical protein
MISVTTWIEGANTQMATSSGQGHKVSDLHETLLVVVLWEGMVIASANR